ncbi:MAG: DNA-binding response regulator [Gammaproteobacteria bacterium]|nr:MAG: DNA-binding response regulator [Gammaproteobacteria bacterium]
MKILIVDDEQLARIRLKGLLQDHAQYEVVGEAGNGKEAISIYEQLKPDIVLMDIRMPGMDGLEAALHLSRLDNPPAVIFVTAYNDHALQAFEAQAVDYLLKPVREERLLQALERASRPNQAQLMSVNVDEDNKPASRTHIMVKTHGKTHLIPLINIYYFQADQKYTLIHHRDGKALFEESLKSLEAEFGSRFVRIHRNALVAVSCISGIEKNKDGQWQLHFKDIDERLEISRRHLSSVKAVLQQLAT